MLKRCLFRTSSFKFFQTFTSFSNARYSRTTLPHGHKGKQKTHYEVLGLGQDASPADIRTAFVKLSKEIHPDKNPNDPENHTNFILLNEAYTILSKPQSRKEYDVSLAYWLHVQQSMARAGYTSHTAGDAPTPGFGPRPDSYEDSQQRVFWDETIWYMRDRSKDTGAFYDPDSYYGIKGIRRQSNSTIVAICLSVIACGFVYFFVAFKFTSMKQRERLEKIDRKNLKLLKETRERARKNGTTKQLEIFHARQSNGKGDAIIQKSE